MKTTKAVPTANQKGGASKTTTAVNLAAALAEKGRRRPIKVRRSFLGVWGRPPLRLDRCGRLAVE